MRCLKRNMKPFHYALYLERQPVKEADEYGNLLETGEYQLIYTNPFKGRGNISPASGEVVAQFFGTSESYDKIIVLDDPKCPINEHSLLWIDTIPDLETDADLGQTLEFVTGSIVLGDNGRFKPYDYVVKKVARTLNSVAIAVSKVNVQ